MNILCIGDIFGKPGREIVKGLLVQLIQEWSADFVIANCDNVAGGRGVTAAVADELFRLPIDVMTAGNHAWEHEEASPHLNHPRILRPYNISDKGPGQGYVILPARNGIPIAVVHLQGIVFMEGKGKKVESPLKKMESLLPILKEKSRIVVVDMHAEATAEKRVLGWYLDGRVSAVVGTHTHMQTADEEILPQGTAYITDLGMTGPHESVIGLDIPTAFERFLSGGEKKPFKVAKGDVRLEGAFIQVDDSTGRAKKITRIRYFGDRTLNSGHPFS